MATVAATQVLYGGAFIPKTAFKRKDAKDAKERKGKYREPIFIGLVVFIFELKL